MSDNVVNLKQPSSRIAGFGPLDVVNRKYVNDLFTNLGGGLVHIGPNPGPDNPIPGQLWYRNDPDGALYIYYDDGNSVQWVGITSSPGVTVSHHNGV